MAGLAVRDDDLVAASRHPATVPGATAASVPGCRTGSGSTCHDGPHGCGASSAVASGPSCG